MESIDLARHIIHNIDNCLAKEVGCPRHPGAFTIGSQLLDGDRSRSWLANPGKPATTTYVEGKADTCH